MDFPRRHLLYASNAVILANHTANWDPFILGFSLPRQICYVASDLHFRRPFVGLLLAATGARPKAKGKHDIRNIREMIARANRGKNIGIFPEGQASWDGTSIPPVQGTAKLVRLLQLPIFCFSIEGAYFSNARWMRGLRRGRIRIKMTRYISVAELKGMDVTTLQQVLYTGIYTDACAKQTLTQTPFSGAFPAQYLERIIFLCPSCLVQERMRSCHSQVYCKHCGYQITYTREGFLQLSWADYISPSLFAHTESKPFLAHKHDKDSYAVLPISTYLSQQRRYFEQFLTQKQLQGLPDPLIVSKNITLRTVQTKQKFETITGTLHGYADRLEITSDYFEKYTRVFTLDTISGFNIQKNERAEFYYRHTCYRVNGNSARFSMLRWLVFINYFSPYSCVGLANK